MFEYNMNHLVPKITDFRMPDVPKMPGGGLFGLFGNEQKKKAPAKKPGKKPPVGKKEEVQALPEKEIVCPYCKEKNKFPKGMNARFCGKCGKAYFR